MSASFSIPACQFLCHPSHQSSSSSFLCDVPTRLLSCMLCGLCRSLSQSLLCVCLWLLTRSVFESGSADCCLCMFLSVFFVSVSAPDMLHLCLHLYFGCLFIQSLFRSTHLSCSVSLCAWPVRSPYIYWWCVCVCICYQHQHQFSTCFWMSPPPCLVMHSWSSVLHPMPMPCVFVNHARNIHLFLL